MFSVQCLLLGLHGYLIRFATLAFMSDCRIRSSKVLSPSVVPQGSEHFTAPLVVRFTSPVSKKRCISTSLNVERQDLSRNCLFQLHMF